MPRSAPLPAPAAPAAETDGLPAREALTRLAERVRRLTVHRRDPDRFFEERSHIAHAMMRLAERL